MRCEHCVRRPRHAGGNASCPLFRRPERQVFAAAGSMRMRTERDSAESAWPAHLAANPQGCSQFRAGDLRVEPSVPAGQEAMF